MIATSQGLISIWDTKPKSGANIPTVLFLHGHCTNKSFFTSQLNSSLLDDYRLIAIDLLGYGESDPPKDPDQVYNFPGFAEVVLEVVEHLKLENLVIVGWSLGGHVALELTLRLDRLKGLLLTGTPPIEISEEGLTKGFRMLDPKILACFGKGDLTEEEAELLATISGYDYSEEKKFLVDAILDTEEGAKTIYPASIPKKIGKNELEIVGSWPQPIAIIAGESDPAVNNDYIMNGVQYRNLWREKVFVIQEAGHAVHMEKPDAFNRILSEFLMDVFSIHEMHCIDPWFTHIREGRKPVEGRKGKGKFRRIQSGDFIRFHNMGDSFLARVRKVDTFDSIEEYLQGVGMQNALPGVQSFEEAKDVYLQWSSPGEIKEQGFLGIWVEPCS